MLDPFDQDRRLGHTVRSLGDAIWTTLPKATHLASAVHGDRVVFGQVGQFVVIETNGAPAFGRVAEIATRDRDETHLGRGDAHIRLEAEAKIQLLSSLLPSGRGQRGISDQPRVGDRVYVARPETLQQVVAIDENEKSPLLPLGTLTDPAKPKVGLPVSALFGRHAAIFGSTGSGKSWTLAHLVEEIAACGGKAILVDATGEFHTLMDGVVHCSVGPGDDKPDNRTKATLPHGDIADDGLLAFLRPGSGVQLPRLREAIRSLRLAHILGAEHPLVNDDGTITKAGRERKSFYGEDYKNSEKIETPRAPFDLRLLSKQVGLECVWQTDRNREGHFGGRDDNSLAYCSSLMLRINDIVRSPEIASVLLPAGTSTSILSVIDDFLHGDKNVLRISLRSLPFALYLREIVVDTIGRHLLAKARTDEFREAPAVVFIDEAHQFFGKVIGEEFSSMRLDSWELIAKEGRKYGLTTCVATQRPKDVPTGVVSQVGTHIVHRLADGNDRDHIEAASTELDRSAMELLPGLVQGEALLVGIEFPIPMSIQMSPPRQKPESEGPQYGNWSSQTP